MSFLHPALLVLLPLAALPVILHLITLRRLKTTELSTFRFLFDSYTRQRSRLRFADAILTALRTLFLLLLVLMFCRPVMKKWSALFGRGAGRDVVLLVDCSASMNARTGGVSALERAKSAARAMVERLGREERVVVLRVTGQNEEVCRQLRGDGTAVREKIDALETGPSGANMLAALKHVFGAGGKREAASLVYLFTDRQASGWREARKQGMEQVVPAGARLIVVDVGSRESMQNVAVVGDAPGRLPETIGLPVVLKARVANHASSGGPTEVLAKALVNDREVARRSVTLKPGEEQVADLTFVPTEAGTFRGRFEIGTDRFPDDDSFLFAVNVRPPVSVLVVNGNPQTDPFEDETLYLRTALTATGGDPLRERFVRSLDFREVPEAGLNVAGASVVILANCGGLSADQFTVLRKFVADGGGLIVFPGERVTPQIYNDQFFPVPGPQRERLTAALLGPPVGDPKKPETFERLTVMDFRHPVLAVFDAPGAKAFATARFFQRFPMKLAEEQRQTWALARFASADPALVESRLGRGVALVAAFPVNSKWSNLPLKPEFVPLVLQMVSYAQRRPELDAPAVASADGASEIAVAGDWGAPTGTVKDESGKTSALAFRRAEGRMVATFEQPRAKGFYEATVKSAAGPTPREGQALFGVNVSAGESDFATVGENELREWMPDARLTVVDASAEAQQLQGTIGEEREVWRPMIWLLFVIMGVEFALAASGGGEFLTKAKRLWRARAAEVEVVK